MPRCRPSCLLGLLLFAGSAAAGPDVIVNDRSLDLSLTAQFRPRLALVGALGDQNLVCIWEQTTASSRSYRLAVSTSVLVGSWTWVQHGVPPAPAGYQWNGDMQLDAPDISQNFQGTFLLFGQVRTSAGPPYTMGLASVRGHVVDANNVTWESPQVVETFGSQPTLFRWIGAVTMAVDPTSSVYVGYRNTNGSVDMIGSWLRRSNDFGTTWSAPIPTGIDTTGGWATIPTIQCGAYGELTMLWYAPGGQILAKRSIDGGDSFGTPVVASTWIDIHATSPGPIHNFSLLIPAATDFYGTTYGSTYVVNQREIDHASYAFPELWAAPEAVEIEPNDLSSQATSVSAGDLIRGDLATGDLDYYSFSLALGQTVMVELDSSTANMSPQIRWYGPDGSSVLTSWISGRMEFTAPGAATYSMLVTRAFGPGGGYRIRTTTGSPPVGGSRDQRDMFVARGLFDTWLPAVNASASVLPAGYDECGPTLTGNYDGFIYMSWYDWSSNLGKAISSFALVRSPDGGQTWQGPVYLASNITDWKFVQWPGPAVFAPFQDMVTDGTSAYYVWVDGRNGDADIYSHGFQRMVGMINLEPTTVTASPGEVVTLQVDVQNLDEVWSWNQLMIRAEPRYREWYLAPDYQFLAEGAIGNYNYAFTVPDSAAPGDVVIDVNLHSSLYPPVGYNPVFDGLSMTLTVLSTTDVDPARARLELLPVTPNPSFHDATLAFSLSRAGPARLAIYDVGGRLVRLLDDGELPAGPHARTWDGTNRTGVRVGAGAYIVQLEAEHRRLVRRMVWLR